MSRQVWRWRRLTGGGSYNLCITSDLHPEGRLVARAYRLDNGGWRACWAHNDDETIAYGRTLAAVQRVAELTAIPVGAERAP